MVVIIIMAVLAFVLGVYTCRMHYDTKLDYDNYRINGDMWLINCVMYLLFATFVYYITNM